MNDILLEKHWQDQNVSAIRMTCTGIRASAIAELYLNENQLRELIVCIRRVLSGAVRRSVWKSGPKWTADTDYVMLSFEALWSKTGGDGVRMEVFMGFQDGAAAYRHHACFFLMTDRTKLRQFESVLPEFTREKAGFTASLS